MRTIAALISAVLIPLAGCELYVDDERDVDASAVDAAPALDATMNDACVCEPHWPGCPSGCEAPAS